MGNDNRIYSYLSPNSAAYLQYVEFATDKVVEKIREKPFAKKIRVEIIRYFVKEVIEIYVHVVGIDDKVIEETEKIIISVFGE